MPKLLDAKDDVQLWDFSDANDSPELREGACSLVASVTRGNSKVTSPTKRYNQLIKEAAGGKPGRVLEFIPTYARTTPYAKHGRYDYIEDFKCYSNARAHIDWYNSIGTEGFIAVKIKAPEFVWQQFATHEMFGRYISRVSESRRVTDIGQYWRPEGITEDMMTCFIKDWSVMRVHNYLKCEGYHKEIYSRFPQGWEYRSFWMCGWLQDPEVWRNLLMERGALPVLWRKTWVQSTTKEYAATIATLIQQQMPELYNQYLRR